MRIISHRRHRRTGPRPKRTKNNGGELKIRSWKCYGHSLSELCLRLHNGSSNIFVSKGYVFLPRDALLTWYVLSSCVCPSVRPSVTRRYCDKIAKRRITETTPHDSTGALVFWRQRSRQNSNGVTATWTLNAGGVGYNRRRLTNNSL